MLFKYKAIKSGGETVDGERDSLNKLMLYQDLKAEGLVVLSAEQVKAAKEGNLMDRINKYLSKFGGVKTREKIRIAQNLGSMVSAGLSLSRSLGVMKKQSKNQKLISVLTSLEEGIDQGQPLSAGMSKFPKVFSSLFVSMVRAGEESGDLAGSLKIVGSQMEKSHTLMRKIRGALIYPAVVIVAMLIIAVLMLIFVIPTLVQTFEGLNIDLPTSTKIILGSSEFLSNNILISLFGFIVIVAAVVMGLRTKKGKRGFDYAMVHLPIISPIIKDINSARTTRTLSSLLSSGVDSVFALEITADVLQNSYYKEVVAEAKDRVQKGESIATIFAENDHLYPTFVAEMSMVGEETGKISEMLIKVAEYYEEEVSQKTKDMSTVIEPILVVIIGAAVALFAISIISPIYSITDSL